MIKAVSFDFWFTLCTTSKERDHRINALRSNAIYSILQEYGFRISKITFLTKYIQAGKIINQEIIDNGYKDYAIETRISRFLDILLETDPTLLFNLKLQEKWGEASERISVPYMEDLLAEIPRAAPHLQEVFNFLKENDVKIALISNTGKSPGKILRQVLEYHGMLDYFDELIFSNEVEMIKPNPKIFLTLANRLDLAPENILHIGDGIFPDVDGPHKIGMKGALYLGTLPENYSTRPTLEEDFHQIQPQYVIDDFQDIPDLLKAINSNESIFYRIRHHARLLPDSLQFLTFSGTKK